MIYDKKHESIRYPENSPIFQKKGIVIYGISDENYMYRSNQSLRLEKKTQN